MFQGLEQAAGIPRASAILPSPRWSHNTFAQWSLAGCLKPQGKPSSPSWKITPASSKLGRVYFERGVSLGFNTGGTALSCEMCLTPEARLEQPTTASTWDQLGLSLPCEGWEAMDSPSCQTSSCPFSHG